MHKKKEEVIPRILVKEPLNLELWLKSYRGLMFQGLFCEFPVKIRKLDFLELFLDRKISGLSPRGCGPWGDRSTVDRRPLPRMEAHRSSASGRSGARELQPRGGGGEGRASELNGGVTVGQEVVEGHLTGSVGFGNGGDGDGAQEH
jgi:hypothetical protein